MSDHWPADTDFASWELDVLDRHCPACGRKMSICDHRYRRLHTLDGPVQLICKLNHCPDPTCPGHAKTKSPEFEITLALPQMAIAWDVHYWIGHRRCSRHMAICLIQSELLDDYQIKLAADAIAQHIRRYQAMLAARQQDAETLISATADEVRRLIQKANEWARALDVSVAPWISDKQGAFVKGIAAEFPDVSHRYRDNHFLRDLAKPVPEADRPTKGSNAEEGARPADDRTSRAPASEGRAEGRPHTPGAGIDRPGGGPVSSRDRSRRRRGARLLCGGAWPPE